MDLYHPSQYNNMVMKKILVVFAFLSFNICFAQTFSVVKAYITNPYVERVSAIRTQMYNMDYVRSHYATYIFSMDKNYINSIFDSLQSVLRTHNDVFLHLRRHIHEVCGEACDTNRNSACTSAWCQTRPA